MLFAYLLLFMGSSEIEMMKERFSKLLLGEDMSGCGNGVCTALAISNAITNLCGMWDMIYHILRALSSGLIINHKEKVLV